jgi:hypothetical protein
MKAITIYQPWASLIAVGAKRFETRSWSVSYKGPVAIHAGKKKPSDVLEGFCIDIIFAMGRAFGVPEKHMGVIVKYLDALPRGAVIATAELAGCWPVKRQGVADSNEKGPVVMYRRIGGSFYEHPTEQELLFGDWTPGRYAWEMARVQMFDNPVPVRGSRGLWDYY